MPVVKGSTNESFDQSVVKTNLEQRVEDHLLASAHNLIIYKTFKKTFADFLQTIRKYKTNRVVEQKIVTISNIFHDICYTNVQIEESDHLDCNEIERLITDTHHLNIELETKIDELKRHFIITTPRGESRRAKDCIICMQKPRSERSVSTKRNGNSRSSSNFAYVLLGIDIMVDGLRMISSSDDESELILND